MLSPTSVLSGAVASAAALRAPWLFLLRQDCSPPQPHCCVLGSLVYVFVPVCRGVFGDWFCTLSDRKETHAPTERSLSMWASSWPGSFTCKIRIMVTASSAKHIIYVGLTQTISGY